MDPTNEQERLRRLSAGMIPNHVLFRRRRGASVAMFVFALAMTAYAAHERVWPLAVPGAFIIIAGIMLWRIASESHEFDVCFTCRPKKDLKTSAAE